MSTEKKDEDDEAGGENGSDEVVPVEDAEKAEAPVEEEVAEQQPEEQPIEEGQVITKKLF